MSETEITFLDTKVYKGVRFDKESILVVQTHYKPTEVFKTARLKEATYPAAILRKYLSEVQFADRKTALDRETNPHVKNFYLL